MIVRDVTFELEAGSPGATLVDGDAREVLTSRGGIQDAAWPAVAGPPIYAIQQKFTARADGGMDDAQAGADFGRSIAMSADGSLALVGAPGANVSGQTAAGAAYIYARGASGWTVVQKLTAQITSGASDVASFAEFGCAVALSEDGNVALIGAMHATAGGKVDAGAVYLYVRGPEGLAIRQKLTAQTSDGSDDTVEGGYFGIAVALTGNGDTAAIGAVGADAGPAEGAGAVYLFGRVGDDWEIQQKLCAQHTDGSDDAEALAAFGAALALSSDGGALLVGANFADAEAGAAYLYKPWSEGWRIWQKLTAQTATGKDDSEPGAMFGAAVAINNNGTTALISACMATVADQAEAGAAYVYRLIEDKQGVETWKIQQKLVAQTANGKNDTSAYARFGKCALAEDTALIGAQQAGVDELAKAGAAYVYQYQNKQWRIRQKLTAQTESGASDAEANARFCVTAISANGATVLVGAFGATASGKAKAGALYAHDSAYRPKATASRDGAAADLARRPARQSPSNPTASNK